jgi:CHAT domain-containing protein
MASMTNAHWKHGRAVAGFVLAVQGVGLAVLQAQARAGTPTAVERVMPRLVVGKEMAETIEGNDIQIHDIPMEKGQSLELIALQKTVDAIATMFDSQGKHVLEADFTGRREELVGAIAEHAGSFRLNVRRHEQDAIRGDFGVQVVALRSASQSDKAEANAHQSGRQALAQGMGLLKPAQPTSSQQALTIADQQRMEIPSSSPSVNTSDSSRAAALKAQDEARRLTQNKAPREQVIAKLKEALRYWRLAGDKKKEFMTLSSIIHQYQQRGDNPQVLRYAQQLLSLAQSAHERTMALSYISLVYQALGEHEKVAEINKNRILESNDPELILLSSLNLAATYANLGETTKSIETLNQLLTYWEAKKEPIRQAEALEGLAYQYFKNGEHNKGLELAKQANRLDPERKRSSIIFNQGISLAIGQVCTKQLEPFKALPNASKDKPKSSPTTSNTNYIHENRKLIEQFRERLQIVRSGEQVSLEAGILTGLALTHSALGESQMALDYYRQALKLFKLTGQRPRQANTLRSIATIMSAQGQKQDAINYLNQALEIQNILKMPFDEAVTLIDTSEIYESLGDYDSSITAYQQALGLFEKIGDRRREADTMLKIGNIYRKQKNYHLALQQFEKTLKIAQLSGNCLVEHSANLNMSRTHEDVGDPAKSYERGQQALTLAENLSDFQFKPSRMANALNLMARAKTKAGDYAASLKLSRRSLEITRQANLQWANPNVYDVIANAYEGLKQYDQAIETFLEKLALVRSLGQYPEEAYIFYFLAKMEYERGRLQPALIQINSAIKVIEDMRQDLLSPDLRTRFFSTKQDYYGLKINILMELHQQDFSKGYDAQAFNTSESSRARTLLELLNESNANIRKGVDPKLTEQENAIKDKVAALEKQWSELAGKNPTERQREFFEQERKLLLAKYKSVQDSIRANSPNYAALKYPQPLTLAQVQQQLLDPDTTLLQYSLGKEKSFLWVVSRDGLQSHVLPSEKEIETQVKSWRSALLDKPDASEALDGPASRLGRLLLEPAAAALKSRRRVIVVPDGALTYAPFAAMRLEGKPLVESHTLLQLPSSSTLALIRTQSAQRPPAPRGLAMVADPIFSGDDPRITTPARTSQAAPTDLASLNLQRASRALPRQRSAGSGAADALPRLPGTRREAERILPLFPGNQTLLALDSQASLALLQSPSMKDYRYVHLATHGVFNTAEPALSGVILSLVDQQGRAVNGFLRLNEIFNLNLPAELVVLSACETGLGEQIRGEGMVGLTRGFLYAGSRRLLVSLWKVDDDATAALMSRFYDGLLREKLTPAQALRAAQNHLRTNTNWDSPYFWSGFVLQGEW